jgi:hypothetical protein
MAAHEYPQMGAKRTRARMPRSRLRADCSLGEPTAYSEGEGVLVSLVRINGPGNAS